MSPSIGDASNGINLIGVGTESSTMGGADLAIALDTGALNTNPAGLTHIKGRHLDLNSVAAFALDVGHRDNFGNDTRVANDRIFGTSFGFGWRLPGRPVTLGLGMFAQGGAGYEYPQLNTAFGTRDELTSRFRIAKLTGGAATEINAAVSLGFSLAATYADLGQRVFPETSFNSGTPATSFFGYRLDDASALGYAFRVGVQYRPDAAQTWGVAYTNSPRLNLEGGTLVSNQTALGLGKVTYRDTKLTGLRLPQELGVGYAHQVTPKFLWTAELTWLDWSKAFDRSSLTASDPDNPSATASITSEAVHEWRDQYVWSLAIKYQADSRTVYRAGYNYGRNPVPSENLSPLLASIAEHHLTAGFGYRLNHEWTLDGGFEYALYNKVTYTNPRLPFGTDSQERGEALLLHFTLSRSW